LVRKGIHKRAIKTCFDHIRSFLITDYDTMIDYEMHCPNCGQVCTVCAIKKKKLFGTKYYCKNCGAELKVERSAYA
jgi:transcription elongation factor Elf1